jgi:hypothetical protein
MTTTEKKTGTCPACQGSGRRPVPEDSRQWIKYNAQWGHWGVAGYEPAGPGPFTDGQGYEGGTYPCNNCGGQTMSCKGTGIVPLRPDGTPCLHEYKRGPHDRPRNCYHHSVCIHGCGFEYFIDSGD